MRHAFRDLSRLIRGKPLHGAYGIASRVAEMRGGSLRRQAGMEEIPQDVGDALARQALRDEIAEIVRQEIDRLDGYLAYHHQRGLRELDARLGFRPTYSSPVVDAIVSNGELDFVIPTTEAGLLARISRHGLAGEPGLRALIGSRVREGAYVIEVGAGVGLRSLPLAQAVGPSGAVTCFESAAHLASALERSIRLNGFSDRVTVYREALFDDTGEPGTQVATLDAVFPPGRRADLVMIAANGAEPQILKGMQRIAAENPRIEIVCSWSAARSAQRGGDPAAIQNEMRSWGFSPYLIESASNGALALTPAAELASLDEAQLLLTRQSDFLLPQHYEPTADPHRFL
jgi:precorrin-6B methylase 2